MKKGRHRRFEEARALKRDDRPLDERPLDVIAGSPEIAGSTEPCAECSAEPGAEHAAWCRATETDPWDEDSEA